MGTLLTRVCAKESLGFSVSGSSHKENVLAGGGKLGKLIKSQTLSFGSSDSVSGSSGKFESNNSESFGNIEESVIVGDSSNKGDNAFKLVVFELRVAVMTEGLDNA